MDRWAASGDGTFECLRRPWLPDGCRFIKNIQLSLEISKNLAGNISLKSFVFKHSSVFFVALKHEQIYIRFKTLKALSIKGKK